MAEDDGFIGLPPGILPPSIDADSGTVRRDRPDRPRAAEREEIVFFPVGAAAPAPPVAVEPVEAAEPVEAPERPAGEIEPPVEPRQTEPFGRAELDDATRASAPRRHAAAAWRLVVEGREVPVEGVLYLGRNPVATAAHPDATVLSIDDTTKSVSKTHAMVEVEAGVLWVHDLDSTNGVWVVTAGGDAIEVIPGQRSAVPAGGSVELGEFVIPVEHG